MKRAKILFFILIFCTYHVSAQEETVKKIRQDYIDYNKKLEQIELGETNYVTSPFKIKTIQVRPALGPVDIEISYYFDEETKELETENMDLRNTLGTLRKVMIKEYMPSFTDYREIFFDAKGNLMFYYSKLTGNTCGEKRMYFNLGKMIKIKFNPLGEADCPKENDGYQLPDYTRYTGKFTKDDLDWEKWILKYAGFHKKAFQNLFESLQ
jgi:hypothetical protein